MARDYTQEIGIPSHKKNMPRPLAFVVLALVAVGITFGVAGVLRRAKEHQRAEKPSAPPASVPAAPAAP